MFGCVRIHLLFSCWVVSDSATLWIAACQASLSFTISWSFLRLVSIESGMLSNHLILCHPLLFCPQYFPALGSFPVSWLFTSRGQSTGASASASVSPMNIHGWFLSGLTGLILLSKGLSRVFSSTTVLSLLYHPALTSIYDYWKNHSFD